MVSPLHSKNQFMIVYEPVLYGFFGHSGLWPVLLSLVFCKLNRQCFSQYGHLP